MLKQAASPFTRLPCIRMTSIIVAAIGAVGMIFALIQKLVH